MTFNNQELQLQVFFPNLDAPLGEPVNFTVNEEIEFSVPFSETSEIEDSFGSGYIIDIADDSILFQTVASPFENLTYNSGDFNGFVFTDVSVTIPG
ncbi:MAG: hypothetical protein AAFQ80_09075 [Cyanobacteria bacterium J06621_8]